MSRNYLTGVALSGFVFSAAMYAQPPARIDFRRDVQPVFKEKCIGCHGPAQQMNGFRLDRRRDAMRGGTLAMIGPGNSEGSRLYKKLTGNQYGPQMPPAGPLSPEQIQIVKAWIDQGAQWPDDVSGEAPRPPSDPGAVRMMEALRNGDRQAFGKILRQDPKAAKRQGPGGSTPLMYAALYGDAESVRLLLKRGADPNIRNEAGVTALMWAVDDVEKSRLLIESRADVNAHSDDARTPLLIAAGRSGSTAVVKLLLDRGANPSAQSPNIFSPMTPLAEAAYAANAEVVQMLIEHGADMKASGFLPLWAAVRSGCAKCVDMLIKPAGPQAVTVAMLFTAPPLGEAGALTALVEHGADIHARGPGGNTILMLAASSDALPVETVKTLIERGADVNAKSPGGMTALDLARQRGETPVVDLLIKAGARPGSPAAPMALQPKPASSVRAALQRTIPLLERADATFMRKSACVSCHNNSLTALAVAAARKNGLAVNDELARTQVTAIGAYLESWRERALQGVGIPGDSDTVSYILLGMAAQNYAADAATAAQARYLKNRQAPDGRWWILGHRPPLEASDFQVTAASMRALQVYAPKPQRAEYDKAVQRAAGWLAKALPVSTEDRAFQLLGLAWAGAGKEIIRQAAGHLLSEQRPDGGWAQIPSLASDAYATGQALVALKESGALAAADAVYQRGARFLMNTQLEDGSWHVKSRAIPIQPYFESDFPHGPDQFISVTATGWAAMALAPAVEEPVKRAAN